MRTGTQTHLPRLGDDECLARDRLGRFIRELYEVEDGERIAVYDDGSGILFFHRLEARVVLTVVLERLGPDASPDSVRADIVC